MNAAVLYNLLALVIVISLLLVIEKGVSRVGVVHVQSQGK